MYRIKRIPYSRIFGISSSYCFRLLCIKSLSVRPVKSPWSMEHGLRSHCHTEFNNPSKSTAYPFPSSTKYNIGYFLSDRESLKSWGRLSDMLFTNIEAEMKFAGATRKISKPHECV